MANLVVVVTEPDTGERSGFEFARHPFADQRAVSVGRARECDIRLSDGLVSRQHARIALTPDGDILVRDLGSSNGTVVDGRTLRGEQVTVASGSRIVVGPYAIVASSDSSATGAGDDATMNVTPPWSATDRSRAYPGDRRRASSG
jgi:pSer/pThr/pTyr-binding forkhead associated (FHA) protein